MVALCDEQEQNYINILVLWFYIITFGYGAPKCVSYYNKSVKFFNVKIQQHMCCEQNEGE